MNSLFENPGLFHIGRKIIVNLDFKNQVNCRHVCRSWNTFIEYLSSKISKEHLTKLLEKFSERRSLSYSEKVSWKRLIRCSCANFEDLRILNLYLQHVLIENNFSRDKNHSNWNSPLKKFVFLGNIKMVKLIIENKLDEIDKNDWTILHEAVECGHIEIVKYLRKIWYFSSWSIQRLEENSLHRNPLHIASKNGNLEMVKILMPDPNNGTLVSDRYGYNPLHIAVTEGHIGIVDYVSRNIGGLKSRNNQGNTPLHIALKIGNIDMMKLLFKKVDEKCIELKDRDGKTVIHTATGNGYTRILRMFCQKANKTILKARDSEGNTPLHLAAIIGHFECVKVLMDYKSRLGIEEMLKIRNKATFTAIDMARHHGYFHIVEYLKS